MTMSLQSAFSQFVSFLYVSDLEIATAFWEDSLGLKRALIQRPPGETRDFARIFAVTPTAFLGLVLKDPKSLQGTQVGAAVGVVTTLVVDTANGVDYWTRKLQALNIPIEKGPIFNERYNIYHLFFRDPDGHLIEIQEFRDPMWPRVACGSSSSIGNSSCSTAGIGGLVYYFDDPGQFQAQNSHESGNGNGNGTAAWKAMRSKWGGRGQHGNHGEGLVTGGSCGLATCAATFDKWHETLSSNWKAAAIKSTTGVDVAPNYGGIFSMLPYVDKRVIFSPPTYFGSYTGNRVMLLILETVGTVFENFAYHRQWISDDGKDWCLEFTCEIGGDEEEAADEGEKPKQTKPQPKKVNPQMRGVDMVKLNDSGHIVEFTVLARPPSAVAKLKRIMQQRVPERLAQLQQQHHHHRHSKL